MLRAASNVETVIRSRDWTCSAPGDSTGSRLTPYETRRLCKDGSVVHASMTASPIFDERGVVVGVSKIARDITDRMDADRMQQVVVEEMRHRTKNILAMVQANELLYRGAWNSADLRETVGRAVAPHNAGLFEISGPDLRLTARVSLALSLALHELGTDAAKYGALSAPGGRIRISWKVGGDRRFDLVWEESGGPALAPPARKGFGSKLIERLLAAELNGTATLDYRPAGLRAVVAGQLQECSGR